MSVKLSAWLPQGSGLAREGEMEVMCFLRHVTSYICKPILPFESQMF